MQRDRTSYYAASCAVYATDDVVCFAFLFPCSLFLFLFVSRCCPDKRKSDFAANCVANATSQVNNLVNLMEFERSIRFERQHHRNENRRCDLPLASEIYARLGEQHTDRAAERLPFFLFIAIFHALYGRFEMIFFLKLNLLKDATRRRATFHDRFSFLCRFVRQKCECRRPLTITSQHGRQPTPMSTRS